MTGLDRSNPRHPLAAIYVVGVLMLAYTLSFIDRQILSLLVEPIKHDLQLSDTQISLMQGFAFAIFLGVGGLPLGWLIDRRRRMSIITAGISFWSLMTAACGLAGSYGSLLLCRMGVGIGEATLTPAAYSVIADSVPKRRLGLALGCYSMGVYIGAGLALVLGASVISWLSTMDAVALPLLGTLRPWQAVFVIVGLPGLLIAGLSLTIREPKRRSDDGVAETAALPMRQVLTFMRAHRRTLLTLILCQSFAAMTSYTANAWAPSFFIRSYGWTAAQTGHAFGIAIVIAGMLGVVAGGLIGDRLVARGWHNGRLALMGIAMLCTAPLVAIAPRLDDPQLALRLLAAATFFVTVAIGTGPTALQDLLPNRMRGTVTALAVLTVNLIGLGLGPTLVALLTDYVYGDPVKLRYALAWALPCMTLIAALFAASGLRPYLGSLRKLRAPESNHGVVTCQPST